jgi:phosphatidylserine synthase
LFERLPLPARKALAWSVHLFTATGAIWGFLTLLAIFEQNWRMTIFWMVIAMFVDGFDGMLARWFRVKDYAKWCGRRPDGQHHRLFELCGCCRLHSD